MRIWFFDQYSKELIPSLEQDKGQDAIQSPCEPGVFIESIYSTRTAPPEYGENETVVFSGTEWEVKADFRELNAWYKKDGAAVSITEIGVEPDGEFVETAPEGIAQPVWDEADNAWREKTDKEIYGESWEADRESAITAMRHECEIALTEIHYRKELPYKSFHVRADEKSQKMLTGYIAEIAFGSRGYPQPWITCENKVVMVSDQAEMMTLATAISQKVEQSILACMTAKEAIDNAEDFETAWQIFEAYKNA